MSSETKRLGVVLGSDTAQRFERERKRSGSPPSATFATILIAEALNKRTDDRGEGEKVPY